jgi:hypothetical protein
VISMGKLYRAMFITMIAVPVLLNLRSILRVKTCLDSFANAASPIYSESSLILIAQS